MSQDLFRWRGVSIITYILVILFGISSWIDINGLWVELPILVQNLPEGWDLPSYMAVIIQIGNIAPMLYTLWSALRPKRPFEVPVIYAIIGVGAVACLLLSFFWDYTSQLAGATHSTALFILQFFLALVDCTSSVAFLPFMSLLAPQYMTAYFIGEGFSGLVPSLVALAQGAGSMECITQDSGGNVGNGTTSLTVSADFTPYPVYKEPKFSVQTFFLMLMSLVILSGIAFTLLNYWSYCKRDHVVSNRDEEDHQCEEAVGCLSGTPLATINSTDSELVSSPSQNQRKYQVYSAESKAKHFTDSTSDSGNSSKPSFEQMSRSQYAIFLILIGWINALSNGVLPSLQTYSCLPYGILTYHLSVTLANIANPVACFATFLLTMTSVITTLVVSASGTALAGYIILTAATSPEPPLVNHSSGSLVNIVAWILVVLLLTFAKVSIATMFRREGKNGLLWVGACTQVGSLCGSLITFFLVNHAKVFETANPCV